jgi:hypothetical protein
VNRLTGRGRAASDTDRTVRSLMTPRTRVVAVVVVFQRLKQQHDSLAIVVDEYGQTAGIITMEDLLEAHEQTKGILASNAVTPSPEPPPAADEPRTAE